LLVALAALSVAPGALAATDDQNLTGLVLLSDGTPLSATTWADNTSLAVWVDHGGGWASAWRYPAAPSWYLTSGGAYSVVLPAAQKDVEWNDADPYRIEFDVSAILGTPGRIENATSNGTGDPGEFSPPGSLDNALVWSATDNWQRWDLVLLALPDIAISPAEVLLSPPGPVQEGTPVTINATVRNLGEADAADVVVRFTDGPPPSGIPIGSGVLAPLVSAGGFVQREVSWTAVLPGSHTLCATADPDDAIPETDEGNNLGCAAILVQAPPETRPDYEAYQPQPQSPVRAGLSYDVTFSTRVRNVGNASAGTTATLAFFNETTPSTPFAAFPVSPIGPFGTSSSFAASWTSPATPGFYRVVADVDYANDLLEWDESNNRFTWTVDVVAGPVTNLVIGMPSVTTGQTYVTSATVLGFSVLDQGGSGIRNTTYRIGGGGPWINYTATGSFSLAGEGPHAIEWFSEDFAGNVEAVQSAVIVVDDTPPTTTAVVGDPKYVTGGTFVTSSTPISLSSLDGAPWPVGVALVDYRVDNGLWSPYAAPFALIAEGAHTVEARAADLLGNLEAASTAAIVVDDTAPSLLLSMGTPQHAGTQLFVTSATPLTVLASDGGIVPVGLATVDYRIDGGTWTAFVSPFVLPSADGTHAVEYAAADRLGHTASDARNLIVDDTPPETTIAPLAGPYAEDTVFALAASDAGAGVAFTEYRIDDQEWTEYVGGFSLSVGDHVIRFLSVDRLGNPEAERTVSVTVVGAPPPTPAPNWKPLVAAVFSFVLAVLGVWSSRRVPRFLGRTTWRRTFLLTALPFVAAEAATGVASALTGLLAIPPVLGIGTITDVSILLAGALVSFLRVQSSPAKNA
jgi:hypothetical protein